MNKIHVALFTSRAAAEPLRQRLQEEGIPAEIHHDHWFHRLWFVPKQTAGTDLEVAADQLDRAEALLKAWDAADGALRYAVRCPECKSLRVEYPQAAHHSIMTNVAVGLSAKVGLVERGFYCTHCHFTWPKEGERARPNRPHMAPYYFIEGIEQPNLTQSKNAQAER